MPPIPKFTREQIAETAMNVVREVGADAFTARKVSEHLGCSTSPIFTAYKDMDELKGAVYEAAENYMNAYLEEEWNTAATYRQQGMVYIRFAMKEPNLFKLIHLGWSGEPRDILEVFEEKMNEDRCLSDRIREEYGLSEEEAHFLHRQIWTYTTGVAALIADRQYTFTEEELIRGVDIHFQAILDYIRSGKERPVPHGD